MLGVMGPGRGPWVPGKAICLCWGRYTHPQSALCWAGPSPALTICTHSISGSRTAWFPLSDTTQAGVSGVAWRRATTASTPMRLAW